MNSLTVTMVFLMGFTGSLHCAGMCGPIVWIMPFSVFKGIKKFAAILLYHIGRITIYALLAILLHSFRSLFEPKIQQYISIILGCSLLVLSILSFLPNSKFKVKLPWAGFVQEQLGNVIGKPNLPAITFAGMLNGLLPCGLVYMALSTTVTTTTALNAALFMYVFGLGTMPMLIGITLLKQKMNFVRTAHIKRFAPILVFAFGCLFVLRGMNLGIPYLSPKVAMVGHTVKACCCHKK